MDLGQFSILEQQDLIEAERKELFMRFVEETNFIYATARDQEQAKNMVERLQSEYFVGFSEHKKRSAARRTAELMEMQSKTYKITPTKSGAYLEVFDNQKDEEK